MIPLNLRSLLVLMIFLKLSIIRLQCTETLKSQNHYSNRWSDTSSHRARLSECSKKKTKIQYKKSLWYLLLVFCNHQSEINLLRCLQHHNQWNKWVETDSHNKELQHSSKLLKYSLTLEGHHLMGMRNDNVCFMYHFFYC